MPVLQTQPAAGAAELEALLEGWRQAPPPFVLRRLFDTPDFARAQELLRLWHGRRADQLAWPAAQRIDVALAGFGTLSYAKPQVELAMLSCGLYPAVAVGRYNQLVQDAAELPSWVGQTQPELIWLWAELEDLLEEESRRRSDRLLEPDGQQAAERAAELLEGCLASARRQSRAILLVNELTPLRRSPLGLADEAAQADFEKLYVRLNSRLRLACRHLGSAYCLPLGRWLTRFGLERAVDHRLRLLADCRFCPEFLFQAARAIRPFARGARGLAPKVLVLDLDNTLWGGLLGEEGPAGVRIGDGPIGQAYAEFQQAVLELRHRGVILAVNSRNNLSDVQELLERRPMPLRLEHFAAVQINWSDKAANCRAIAQELNVGADSLVFWDDDPQQREWVARSLPEVHVIDVPADPSCWAGFLRECDLFDSPHQTAEDARRGELYAQQRLRQQAQSAVPDLQQFLHSLELEVRITSAGEEDLPRLAELLARTNQFNLTTRRHGLEELRRWLKQPDWAILAGSAQDRFGSYGLVGLAILHRQPDHALLDSLLLSCRAMGKGIEQALLAAAVRQARQWGLERLGGSYIPTRKNAPASDFLPASGFVLIQEGPQERQYELDLARHFPAVPAHIRLNSEGNREKRR